MNRHQDLLAELGRVITSAPDFRDVFEVFADRVKEVMEAEQILISSVDLSASTYTPIYLHGQRSWQLEFGAPRPLAGSAHAMVLRSGVAILFDETNIDSIDWSSYPGGVNPSPQFVSWIVAPLIVTTDPVGMLIIRCSTPNAYGPEQVELAGQVCNQIAGAFANWQRLQAVQQEANVRKVLADLGRIATSAMDIGEVYDELARTVAQIVPLKRLVVSTITESGTHVLANHVYGTQVPAQPAGTITAIPDDVVEVIHSIKSPMVIDADVIKQYPGMTQFEDLGPRSGLSSWLIAPLVWEDKVIGALHFRDKEPGTYDAGHIKYAGLVADHMAGTVANAGLHKKLRRETEIRTVLADLGRITNLALDVRETYDELARNVARIVPLDRLVVTTYSESFTISTDQYVFGVPIAERYQGAVLQLSQGVVEAIRTVKSPVIVDADFAGRFPAVAQHRNAAVQHGFRSWIFAPLMWRDTIIGSLQFQKKESDHYDAEHLRIAALVADQISGAVASSRAYQIERRESDIRKALANISLVVSQDLNVRNVYDRVADELKLLIPYDRMVITLFNPETEGLTLDYVQGLALPEDSLGDDITHPDRTRTWRSYFERGGKSGTTDRERALAELGLQSWIQATIGTQLGGSGGFLSIRSRNPDQYSDEDSELLRQIAAQITPAIQNARLFEQSIRLSEQRERAEALDEENIELQRIADARSEFLSTVSHELRTPLTSISAFSDILARNRPGTLTDQQIDQIEVIRRSTSSLTGLIDDLLDVSRADTGRLNVQRAPFEIRSLISEFADDAMRMIDSKSQRLSTVNIPEPAWIDADRNRIVQILNNLISNASKYSPPSTQIYLRVNVKNGKLEVEIEDEGIGISSHDISSVYVPFFRAPNKDTQHESGTGLGLSIVKTLVELHGGEIHLESELGLRTKALFWIPGITSPPDQ